MRTIDKIIIHCTATPQGRAVTVQEITRWHKERGWLTIGYHWVIGINGEVWQGRNELQEGAHCEGQNAHSIGVCYVGGLTTDCKKEKDTRTPLQMAAMLKLVKEIKVKYPHATVHGHNEFSAKACPSFSVKAWAKNNSL